MQGLDWNDLRHVLAVTRTGTLAAAGRRLGVDATTVARRLRVVEAELDARLFLAYPVDADTHQGQAFGRLGAPQM